MSAPLVAALPKRRRRRLRFSLRTLVVFTALLSVGLGWLGNTLIRIQHQRRIVAQVEAAGGQVSYDYIVRPREEFGPLTPPGPKLLRLCLGDDAFAKVSYVDLLAGLAFPEGAPPVAGDDDLQPLTGLPALTILNLGGGGFTDEGARHLERLIELRSLSLSHTRLTKSGLAQLGNLPHLETLSLVGPTVTDETAAGLAGLKNLKQLTLGRTQVSSDGLVHLQGLGLCEVRIYDAAAIGDEGLAHLAKAPELQSLHLWVTSISDAGLAHLKGLRRLRELEIHHSPITDEGLKHVGELQALQSLSLRGSPRGTHVGDGGLTYLKPLAALERLNLCGSQISDAGMQELAKMRQLRHLDISQTAVTDVGLAALGALDALESLEVGPHVTHQAATRLQQRLPKCRISSRGQEWWNDFVVE